MQVAEHIRFETRRIGKVDKKMSSFSGHCPIPDRKKKKKLLFVE